MWADDAMDLARTRLGNMTWQLRLRTDARLQDAIGRHAAICLFNP